MAGPRLGSGSDDDDRRRALSIMPVSRETENRFAVYVDLLRRWQSIKNLVGPSTLDQVWTRHIADSAQLAALAPHATRWIDLGSGAGFPGLVIALMLRERAGAWVDLIESNTRKCAFLREVIRATGAPARVHMDRIANALPRITGAVDVVTSRALAPLPELLAVSRPLLDGGACGLFMVGDDSTLPGSDTDWAAGLQIGVVPSLTHPAGRIVSVRATHATSVAPG